LPIITMINREIPLPIINKNAITRCHKISTEQRRVHIHRDVYSDQNGSGQYFECPFLQAFVNTASSSEKPFQTLAL
jgi:hypothetical protein